MKLLPFFLDLIYPRGLYCYNCGSSILFSEVSGLCQQCLQEIELLFTGGEPGLRTGTRQTSNKISDNIDIGAAARYTGIIKNMLLAFKYYGEKELARPLAELMLFAYKKYYSRAEIDYIIPVPLHRKRKEMRGYNQSYLLARYLQQETGIELAGDFLVRLNNTPPLYNLPPSDRQQVLAGSFTLKRCTGKLKGCSILLVDDILTTGSTAAEIAFTLKREAKVHRVSVLTVATP